MKNLLYVVALFLILFWAIGFLYYSVGAMIHLLLVIALVAIVLRVTERKEPK